MIIVRRTYMPKPGDGGKLLRVIRQLKPATEEAGFPPIAIYRQVAGPHGMLVTVQRWPSLAEYEKSRETLRQTEKVTKLFEQVYPLLASTHLTEFYEEIEEVLKA